MKYTHHMCIVHVGCQNKIRGFEKFNLEFFLMGKVKDELVENGVSHVQKIGWVGEFISTCYCQTESDAGVEKSRLEPSWKHLETFVRFVGFVLEAFVRFQKSVLLL